MFRGSPGSLQFCFVNARNLAKKKAGEMAGPLVHFARKRLARRLAAAGEADFFLQAIETDCADHHLFADHITRRAVHAH